MTSLIPRSLVFPDFARMLEAWPFTDHHPVRVEGYRDDGDYVLRAELPGMDPEKDIHISVRGNDLVITAERTLEQHDTDHTEFTYGKFARTVRLPDGARTDEVAAHYDAGILEVKVPLRSPEGREVAVTTTK